MNGLFVTGTDTDIGKTALSALLLAELRRRNINAAPMKPAQTGCARKLETGNLKPEKESEPPTTRLTPQSSLFTVPDLDYSLSMASMSVSPEAYANMSPYTFEPACSPHLAAEMAGTEIEIAEMVIAARTLASEYEFVIAEGAGGIIVPLNRRETMLDLMQALKLPVLIAARPGLGTINHTLLSIQALRSDGLDIAGVVFVASQPDEPGIIEEDNATTIEQFGKVPILGTIPYCKQLTDPKPNYTDLPITVVAETEKIVNQLEFNVTQKQMTFGKLVDSIELVHGEMAAQASKAVNVSLTLRNWLIGYYIKEYEQNGTDRATYGAQLLATLSRKLDERGMERVSDRELRRYRTFSLVYPQIWESLTPKFKSLGIRQSMISELDPKRIRESATPKLMFPGKKLIEKLSFTHLAELIKIDNDLKRTFYEVECIKGCWSVRELKRQIASLYYERSGLSKDKKALAELVQSGAETTEPKLAIRDPYIFEFLGLKPKEVMGESDLEDGLLDKLQEFLLELGHGFCFEDRQKRILLGDTYGFIDLVFYHRILKCHVLIDLKMEKFSHENIGQRNTYVSWYKQNMMTEGDNPPVGLLLCTQKDHPLVEYALAGMDNNLFVSKYQLELPETGQLKIFLEQQMKELGDTE